MLFCHRFAVTTYTGQQFGMDHHIAAYIYICIYTSLDSYAVCQLAAAVADAIRAADDRNRRVFAAARVYSLTVPPDYVLDLALA
jgi:hypothetical protein